MVELGKTGCHFAAARSRSCHDHKRTCRFNVVVLAITFIADNCIDVVWVALNRIMMVNVNTDRF